MSSIKRLSIIILNRCCIATCRKGSIGLLTLLNGVYTMFEDLLTNRKYIITNMFNTKIHRHCIWAKQINNFFIDISEVGICCKTLVNIRLLLVSLINWSCRILSSWVSYSRIHWHLFTSCTSKLTWRQGHLLSFFNYWE